MRCFSCASSSRCARCCCCSLVSGTFCAGCAELDEPAGCGVCVCGWGWGCACVDVGAGACGGGLCCDVACGASGNSSVAADCAQAVNGITEATAIRSRIRVAQSVKEHLPEIKTWLRPEKRNDCCLCCGHIHKSELTIALETPEDPRKLWSAQTIRYPGVTQAPLMIAEPCPASKTISRAKPLENRRFMPY